MCNPTLHNCLKHKKKVKTHPLLYMALWYIPDIYNAQFMEKGRQLRTTQGYILSEMKVTRRITVSMPNH